MISNILRFVRPETAPVETRDEPVYGRLVPPSVPAWSYPFEEQREKKGDESPDEEVLPPRIALLPGLQADVLRPVRMGHDYVGGMIASLAVVTVGLTLLLFQLLP